MSNMAATAPIHVNDETTADQKRIVARLGARWFLQGLGLVRGLGGGDILDGLIMLAVVDANTRHLNGPDGQYHSVGDIPPDEARQPVSVYLVARELGISYETARRHVQRLIKAGRMVRSADGIMVPGQIFAQQEVMGLTHRNYLNTRRFIDELKGLGIY
jgi:biotin operon repressor